MMETWRESEEIPSLSHARIVSSHVIDRWMACGAMATYKHMHGNLLGDTKARILLHPSPILRKPDTYGDSPFRLGFLSGFLLDELNVWSYRTCLRTCCLAFVVHCCPYPVSLQTTCNACIVLYIVMVYGIHM